MALATLTVLAAAGCRASSADAQPRPDASTARAPAPPIVVTVVIDQFAGWLAEQRLALLPATGGFARLRREGTWVQHMAYAHSATDTAPGHSALYTASPPRESGIFANELPDDHSERVSILRDAATRRIGPDGPLDSSASSLAQLRVPTLADRLRDADRRAVVVAVSLKDRGALFGGGRAPNAVLWFDPAVDSFVTSTAFATEFPAWARAIVNRSAIRALRAQPWQLDDATWVRTHAATADTQRGEGDLGGYGTVFPHDFARAQNPGAAFRVSPLGDQVLFTLALAAIDAVHDRTAPMLLAISLSSNDYIGHAFGPDSWESWDELHRLDAALGNFMAQLDARLGPTGWSLLLSADHGVVTLPEAAAVAATRPWCTSGATDFYQRPCGEIHRLIDSVVARELEPAAQDSAGPGHWVRAIADPYVYFTPEAHALPRDRWARLVDAVATRLRARPEVAAVIDAQHVAATCPDVRDESLDALVCRSIPSGIEPTLYIALRPGSFFDANYTVGFGTSHGSPYRYDRVVPLLVRAPGRVPPGQVITQARTFTLFAETAADLLGFAWPSRRNEPLAHAGP